jgi:FkbM family methyltransferase
VYAFEPCYGDFKDKTLDSIIKTKEQIKIIPKGLWGESTVLKFRKETEHKVGSAIVEAKPRISRPHEIIELQVTSIDDFVGDVDKKIDFIKMDIEGAELSVLEGAMKTIRKDRPQLAISIYHTDEHFYKVPLYLKEKLSDYVFRLAHYDCNWCETVLYAIPRELYLKN